MYDQGVFGDGDLITNTAKRVPVCLCLDVSSSMSAEIKTEGSQKQTRIDQLNQGVAKFYESVRKDETAAVACEIAIVTFESTAQLEEDFEPVDRKSNPNFTARGGTDMGAALTIALRILEERKQKYKDYGTPYYQPWLVVMSDGEPFPSGELDSNVIKIQEMQNSRKLTVYSVGIAEGYNTPIMKKLSNNPVIRVNSETDFSKLFQWLSMSIAAVATGGDPIGWVQ